MTQETSFDPCATLSALTTIGGFTIEQFIGSGGFGSIYRGIEAATSASVAIKVLHPELRGLGDPMIRFMREADVLSSINHPNVVKIRDSGILGDGRAYFVMELLEGCDLEEHIEEFGQFSLETALEILEPVCDALTAAHAQGVVHRDIKASNVFLDRSAGEDRVVLLDFGIAKVAENDSLQLSSSRMALGTPNCMAPEQIRGSIVDQRADIYALGGLAFRMLSGRKPFEGDSCTVLHYMQLYGRRPSLSEAANLGPAIDAVIARAMSTNRDDRYGSAEEFLDALQQVNEERVLRRTTRRQLRQERRQALGIYVDVRVEGDRDTGDEQLLDETDAVLDAAQTLLSQRGFSTAFEGSSATLFARELDDEEPARLRQTREAIIASVDLHRHLGSLVTRGITVNVCVHRANVICSGGQFRGGELLRLDRWAPDLDIGSACFSEAALEGIDIECESVPNAENLRRLITQAPKSPPSRQKRLHQQMMAQLGRQTASVVHDLRSPLTGVLTNIQWVLEQVAEGEPFTADAREALTDAAEAAEQLSSMTGDILHSSSMESYSPSRRVVSVPAAVDRAINLTRGETCHKATVHVFHEGKSYFMGSAGRLTQVLTNLLINAAQAIEGHGEIFVRTQVTDDGMVQIAVRDTGTGIQPEAQAQIFEPFFTTKGPDEGTGLGLATVREVVEEHGGSVSVDSSPGVGTCFTIRLPSAPGATDATVVVN